MYDLYKGMRTHGVPRTDSTLQIKGLNKFGYIIGEFAPPGYRAQFFAASMATLIDRNNPVAFGYCAHDLIPTAGMKASRVDQEDRRRVRIPPFEISEAGAFGLKGLLGRFCFQELALCAG